ncbi:MAG: tetratricopeptide repeat protein [Ardenticatenaceae bacterium]|nr:tetratricopeptide repeat protein [Ardenticatenaceae bacterium]
MSLITFLPQDRLRALARGETLPESTTGAALFADISGFTPLTEKLTRSLGPRRGIEDLTRTINAVYAALIAEVERFGGSVIGFAGDAMTCWFDERVDSGGEPGGENQSPTWRAVTSAFALQAVLRQFPDLGLKVAVTTGPARRFVVGDPADQLWDTLAGHTIVRLSTAEHLANRGDIVVDEATFQELGDQVQVETWRTVAQERFAVLSGLVNGAQAVPAAPPLRQLTADELGEWVNTAVFAREQAGQGVFLTELRPVVALFLRFTGISYETDQGREQLDIFLRQAQAILRLHEGALIQLTIGDKGSYLYAAFGAPVAHEDDARRAMKTALDLRRSAQTLPYLEPVQIGLTRGVMRTGAYGGATRRTYGVLGDEVNLAARLMTTAGPGEILVSGQVHKAVREAFAFEPRPPLRMKGKAEPLPVFAVTGERQQRAIRLQEPTYALPMVGRQEELQTIEAKLDLAAAGQSQIIGIVAEAGLGKSRLVAEVIRSARRKGFVGYGGTCQSDGIHTPYLPWKTIWQAFFDVNPEMPIRRQIRYLEGEIEDRAPDRVEAMPLLNVVLDLHIPENEFTQNLEPKNRQSALHALLEDCLKAQAEDEPTLIVIEDLHWVDILSHGLLEGLANALAQHAVCFVLAYRPPELLRLQEPRLEALPQFTKVELRELTGAEAESAIRAKLAQLYPARGGTLPTGLVEALMARAQGNPFYLEELLNYVRDRGLDPSDLNRIELPNSLHTLILSRIDQLSEQEKTTLRVASIIGRLFRAAWLNGYYPDLGAMPQVKQVLDQLDELEITPLDSEPELIYLFKHIVTHEVTYRSLPFTTRARLHEQLARYLEEADAPVEAIAFHYEQSENKEKQCEYLRKAGKAAQKNYANEDALAYYGTLLPLLTEAKEQTQIYLKRGKVLQLIGRWDDAEADYRAALDAARDDRRLMASACCALGELNNHRGDYAAALDWLAQAKEALTAVEDTPLLTQAVITTGFVWQRKGAYAQAQESFHEGLALARQGDDKFNMAEALNGMGLVANLQSDLAAAQTLFEESLSLRRAIGDKRGLAGALNNLGIIADSQGNYALGRARYEESLALMREIGDKRHVAFSTANLGLLAFGRSDFYTARALCEESLALFRELGDKMGLTGSLANLGNVALAQGDYPAAQAYFEEALAWCQKMDEKTFMAYALLGLGLVELAENKPGADGYILESLKLRWESGEQLEQTSNLVGMAAFALQKGNPLYAAQLLGTVEAALQALQATIELDIIHFYAQTVAKVQEQLDEAAWRGAWEEGGQWGLAEVVERVLETAVTPNSSSQESFNSRLPDHPFS